MNGTDRVVAGVVTGLALLALGIGALAGATPEHPLDLVSVVLATAQGVVLLWRRRAPLLVLAASTAAVVAHGLLGHPNAGVEFGPYAAAYAVGAYVMGWRAWAAALVAGAASGAVGVTPMVATGRGEPALSASLVAGAVFFMVIFMAGRLLHSRRQASAARLDAALAEERTRIARELHDVIAHHVGAMVIQAGAGRRVLEKDGDVDRARDALAAIERSGRTALMAVPVVIGALRGDSGTAPQPTLALLDEVTTAAAEAGLAVDVTIEGTQRDLPAPVEVSAFRIVQEAVTNAMKHAGPATVEIRLRYAADALDISVVDDGRGATPDTTSSGRYGLAGMRERATLLGGRLEAGPRPSGGFEVHAWLPVQPA